MAVIIHVRNPFDPINSRDIVLKDGGLPLHNYFDHIDEFYEIVASVNGHIVEDYEMVVRQNDSIAFVAIPKGGGGGGKNILSAVAMIALVVAAPYMVAAIAGMAGVALSYTGYMVALGAVMIGGGQLVNTLLAPPTPDFNNPSFGEGFSNSATYSWGTQTNSIQEGIAIPIVYGTARIVPPIISQYVETIGNKQYLNLLFALNDGEITSISDIYINDNPIAYYTDVTYDYRLGTNTQTLIPSFDNTRVDSAVNALLSDTTYVTRQCSSNTTNEITVTLVAGQGLYRANDTGGLETVTVPMTIEYRAVGDATWLSFVASPVISASQNSPYRVSFTKSSLVAAQYEVRIKRNTAQSTNTRTADKVAFEAITEVIYDDFTYPNTALLSIRALATDQLSGGRPTISVIVTANSNNPSLIVQDILTKWAGVAAGNISASDFSTWGTFCTTNNYKANIVFDTAINIRQAIDTVSQLGRASIVRMGATYLPIVDKADTLPTQGFLFTMGNIIENSFSEEFLPVLDRSNVIEVTYFDETLDYERQSIELYQSGFDESTSEIKKSSIALYGCTDRAMAIKHGRFLLNKARYLTLTVSFEVALDAIACRVGDIISVAHDVPQWGYSGRLVDSVGTVLTLDKEITMLDDGTNYAISLRLSGTDDIVHKNIVVPTGGYTGYEVEVTVAFATQPAKYDIYSFGELSKTTKEFRVMSITRSAEQLRKISAIEYIEEIYLDGVDTIPIVNKSSLSEVSNLQASDGTLLGSNSGAVINVTWIGYALSWDIYYKSTISTEYIYAGISVAPFFQIQGLQLGYYDIKVGDKTATIQLLCNTAPLPDITGLISFYRNEQTVISWDTLPDLRNPIDYEIRLGTIWEDGTLLGKSATREYIVSSDGAYMIKAHYQTAEGVEVYSTNESQILVSGAIIPKNIIASYDEKATLWQGTLTNISVDADNNLQMYGSGLFDDIPDFDIMYSLDYYGGVVTEASYEIPSAHIIDVGTAQKCRLWVEYNVQGIYIGAPTNYFDNIINFDLVTNLDLFGSIDVSNKFSMIIQVSIAQNDGIFGAWQNFNTGDYIGRKFKFRGLFYSFDAEVTIVLSKAVFYVDMEDKIQSANNVSIASGGTSITYPLGYQVVPSTNITIINAVDGDEIKLTSETNTGFTAQIKNAGVGVARTINWLSKGY